MSDAKAHAPAFRCRGESLSYQDLADRAARLANALLQLGLKPMDRVGIFMNKGIDMPVAVYGILMAGGAYVPIDPKTRPDRLSFILKDCCIRIIITDNSKKATVRQACSDRRTDPLHVIGWDQPGHLMAPGESLSWGDVLQAESKLPDVAPRETDLAYIMYTSGSTGTPKGLMHTHSSGLAYARHSKNLYSVTGDDVLGNHAPLHFDISTFEFLTGPFAGSTTVLIPEEAMLFPASLSEIVARERITIWYSVPLALIQILQRGRMQDFDLSSLRWVLFGGEPFPPKHLRKLMDLLPKARFCNVYGPAEVNQCTYFHIPADFSGASESIPLGWVWDGAHALIVDEDDQIVPDTRPGELLIHSASMMHAYWGRPDLNEKAFFFEEAAPGFTRKYYRTGDLVRRSRSGLLEFLGRKDRQVKIRGYRLELDEVEAVFASLDSVQEAAAVIAPTPDGERELVVAVLRPGPTDLDTQNRLIEIARQRLPHYGVPKRLEIRSEFPRTTSGKIDRTQIAKQYEQAPATRC